MALFDFGILLRHKQLFCKVTKRKTNFLQTSLKVEKSKYLTQKK